MYIYARKLLAPWPSPSGSCSISSPLPSRDGFARRAKPLHLAIVGHRGHQGTGERFGVELFEHHPRGLNITHKGHSSFATRPRSWRTSPTRAAFLRRALATTGRLQLGVTSLVAGYVLSDLLARYRRAYPGVEISAVEDDGDYLEHLLVGGGSTSP